jgi:hypothetical protein
VSKIKSPFFIRKKTAVEYIYAAMENDTSNYQTKKISVSLPRELLEKIDRLAEHEHRNRSNMISALLREEINSYETKKHSDGK